MGRKPISYRVVLFVSLLMAIGVLASCSDEVPTAISPEPNPSGQGDVDPLGDKDFLLGSTSPDGMGGGRIDVWAHNLTVRSDSSGVVVAFDVVLINRSPHAIYPPVLFFITKIVPSGVHVLNSEIVYITDGPPGFDFSDDLGDDNKLDPREHSAPVNMQFGMEELKSFSIGFRITASPPPMDAVISGVVFSDGNANGERDSSEVGIPGVRVRLSAKVAGTDPFEFIRIAETDRHGRYGFAALRPGVYEVEAIPHFDWKPTTPNPVIVTLVGDSSGVSPIDGVDFGFLVPEPPQILPVFGPVQVGPGSPNGRHFEGIFWAREGDMMHKYVLHIMPPPILSAAVLMRIREVRVWVNGEIVYKFECESMESACLPGERVVIPPRLLRGGPNEVRIFVDGSERAFLTFTIFRVG